MNAIEHGELEQVQHLIPNSTFSRLIAASFSYHPSDRPHLDLHHYGAGREGTGGVLQVGVVLRPSLGCSSRSRGARHVFGRLLRLKKIQEKKKQLRERTEREIAARLAKLGPIAEPANMLTEETDEDLLFE